MRQRQFNPWGLVTWAALGISSAVTFFIMIEIGRFVLDSQ